MSLFIGDAPTFAVVIVGFTFIYITRTVIENQRPSAGRWECSACRTSGAAPSSTGGRSFAILYALVLVVGFLIHRFDHSQLGRAASAVFVDQELATSLGVDIKKLGMLVQTFSCTMAGGCGVLYGFIYKSFHLDFFTFALVGIFMTVIFVGGYATLWGVVLAAPILYGVPLLFPPEIASWRIVIYGALLILVLVLKPEGFITPRFVYTIETFLSRRRRKRNIPLRRTYEMKKKSMVVGLEALVLVLLAAASGSARPRWSSRNGRSRS